MRLPLAFAATPLAVVLAACQPECRPLSEDDIAAIRSIADVHLEHVEARDWDALLSVYAEDALAMQPNQPDLRGHEAMRRYMDTYPPVIASSMEFVEIDGCGDLAYARGVYSVTVEIEGGEVSDTGRFLYILRRGPTGQWLITLDIVNSDQPLPTGGG